MPVFGHLNPLKRLTGLIYFPITPTFPLLGLLGGPAYLPAKFHIRFLEPIPTDQWGEEPWDDKGLVQTVAEEVRGRIQEELYEMLAAPPVGLARMSRRVLITGLSSYWGGRLAQVLERDDGATRRSSASRPRTRRCRWSARSTSASAPSTRCCAGSCTPPRSTR